MVVPTQENIEIAELRRKQALYLASLEALDEGACLYERLPLRADGLRDYRYIWMNAAMQRMFGIADLSGQSIRDNFKEEVEAWYDDYDRVLDTGAPIRIVRESAPQGMVLEMSVTRVQAAGTAVLLAVMRDVTARVRAEKALRDSEQRLRALVTATSDFIYHVDPDWTEISHCECGGFLRPAQESTQSWLDDYIDKRDKTAVVAAIQSAKDAKAAFELEHRVKRADGTLGWVLSRAVPLMDDTGEIREWFGVASDVTGRHRAMDALLRNQRLEAVARLSGNVAHDFNNLLLVVMSNIEMAGLQAVSHDQTAYLDAAARMVEVGGKLSKRLTGWSTQTDAVAQDLDLNTPVSDIVDILGRTLVRGYQLQFDASPHPAMIHVDPVEIDAALMNLVMNARDATPLGGRITVRIEILPELGGFGPSVCLSVADKGSGMTEDIRKQACDSFFTTRPQGTGLGLYSVSEMVHKAGGFLEIESEEGQGSTVRLFFPLIGRAVTPPSDDTDHKATILLVEDQHGVRQVIRKQLQALGYRVIEASDAAQAHKILQQNGSINLVFSDIVMPGEWDGRDLIRLVQKDWPGIAVLLTTGNAPLAPETARDADGMTVPVLRKPYRMAELNIALLRALSAVTPSGPARR